MKFHPLTHIIVAIEVALCAVILPVFEALTLLTCGLLVVLFIPPRTEVRLTRPFLKVLAVAAFFLFVIHGMRWNPPGISQEGIIKGLESFIHIAVPFAIIIYLSKRILSEELFALLLDLRVPPLIILVLFRTLWLVPRLMERMEEVVTAQKLRGMRIENAVQRTGALIPTLSPIFSSMLDEISENSLIITARGFLLPGRKSHLLNLRYRWIDVVLTGTITIILLILWY